MDLGPLGESREILRGGTIALAQTPSRHPPPLSQISVPSNKVRGKIKCVVLRPPGRGILLGQPAQTKTSLCVLDGDQPFRGERQSHYGNGGTDQLEGRY